MHYKVLFASAGALALASCASPEPAPFNAKMAEAQSVLLGAPSWYPHPPHQDGMLSISGSAVSYDADFAIDKARLAAETRLAEHLADVVSSKRKDFADDNGQASERVRMASVSNVHVKGFQIEDAKVTVTANSLYRAFVLLTYKQDDVKEAMSIPDKKKASQAFEELERDIQAAKPKDDEPPPPAAAPNPKVKAERL